MANKENKYPENVTGSYYVDNQCIVCGLCVMTAPYNFRFTAGDKYAYVNKQPEDDEEKSLCLKAMESCPAEAIGDDG